MSENFEQYLEQFEDVLLARRFTASTINTYKAVLSKFLKDFDNPQRVATHELIKYIGSMPSDSFARQMHGVLQNFFTYVLKQKRKFEFIPYPNKEKRLRQLPTFEQVKKMIELTSNTKHRLIIRLLAASGLRVSELTGVRWIDIKREQGENPLSVHVRGKGNKDRIVGISNETFEEIKSYCKEYGLNCATNSQDYIFGDNKPYSVRSIQIIVKEAALRVGIKTKLSAHTLRHVCFQYLYDNGTPLERIQEIAGHSSFTTTRIYAKKSNTKIVMPL